MAPLARDIVILVIVAVTLILTILNAKRSNRADNTQAEDIASLQFQVEKNRARLASLSEHLDAREQKTVRDYRVDSLSRELEVFDQEHSASSGVSYEDVADMIIDWFETEGGQWQ